MKPLQVVESLKLTYDLVYAREVAQAMVRAAYPAATEDEKPGLQSLALAGFQWGSRPAGVMDWTLADIKKFVELYETEFLGNRGAIDHYAVVRDLLKTVGQRVAEVSSDIPGGFPAWFTHMYIRPAFASATSGRHYEDR